MVTVGVGVRVGAGVGAGMAWWAVACHRSSASTNVANAANSGATWSALDPHAEVAPNHCHERHPRSVSWNTCKP